MRPFILTLAAASFAACTALYPLDDVSGGVDAARAPRDAEPPTADAGAEAQAEAETDVDAAASAEPPCVGPQESEANDDPATADPLPASTTVCGFFDGDPDVFTFDHGHFGTVEIAIDAAEPLEVAALIGGMVFDTQPRGGTIVAPVVNEGTAIVTVRRGNAPLGKRVRYELTRTGP